MNVEQTIAARGATGEILVIAERMTDRLFIHYTYPQETLEGLIDYTGRMSAAERNEKFEEMMMTIPGLFEVAQHSSSTLVISDLGYTTLYMALVSPEREQRISGLRAKR